METPVTVCIHTHSKHLHEQLLLLLLGPRLRVLVHLEAAGGQETVVVVEEGRTPELLLEEAKPSSRDPTSPRSESVICSGWKMAVHSFFDKLKTRFFCHQRLKTP